MGDKPTPARTTNPITAEGFQYMDLLDGAKWIAASSVIAISLVANTIY
jgi:hypothetical protein